MSHSFYVPGVSGLSVEHVFKGAGLPDLFFTEDSPDSSSGDWPAGTSYVYQDQVSVRPVEITLEEGVFQSRIFSGSSPDDYRLGLKLAVAVASVTGSKIEPEDGDPLTVAELQDSYGEAWIKEHSLTTLRMLVGQFQQQGGEGSMTLSGTRSRLKVGPRFMSSLLEDPDSFSRNFYDRFRRLNYIDREDVYSANVMKLGEQDGDREVRLTVYSEGVPSLLPAVADLVTVRGVETFSGRPEGTSRTFNVSIDDLAKALGDRGVWLSEDFLFASHLEGADWDALQDSLAAAHVEDIFSRGSVPTPTQEESAIAPFSHQEWSGLCMAPTLIFVAVAAADGEIDPKEIAAYQDSLRKAAESGESLYHRILLGAMKNSEAQMEAMRSGQVDPEASLRAIGTLFDARLSPEESHELKTELFNLGLSVAQASGGGLFGFGSKIDKKEKAALAFIAVCLGLGAGHGSL